MKISVGFTQLQVSKNINTLHIFWLVPFVPEIETWIILTPLSLQNPKQNQTKLANPQIYCSNLQRSKNGTPIVQYRLNTLSINNKNLKGQKKKINENKPDLVHLSVVVTCEAHSFQMCQDVEPARM